MDSYRLDVIASYPFYFMSDGVYDIIHKCMHRVCIIVQLCVLVIHCVPLLYVHC